MSNQDTPLPCRPLEYDGIFSPYEAGVLNPDNIDLGVPSLQPANDVAVEVLVSGET